MKKLETLNLARLTNLEFGQHTKNIYNNIIDRGQTAPPLEDAVLIQYLAALNLRNEAYDRAVVQIAKSDETAKIVGADLKRDRALTSIQRYLSVFEFSPIAQEAEMYQSLNTLFNNYKRLQFWNFEEESNGIDNLLAELQNTKYSPMAETIGMTPYINRLAGSNTEFKAIFNSRTQESATREVFDVKQLRSDLKMSYEKTINYILTMAIATDSQEFNDVLAIVNTIRKYYSDMLARRKSENKNATETPTPA